jgi:hypothetical protein
MFKTFAFAALLLTATALPVLAAPPADQEACDKLAFDLAEKAAAKKLPDADALKVDGLVNTLTDQCGAGKLAEAGATADQIEAAIK